METEKNTKQDCNCSPDCCTPKKSKLWMKILFIVIVVAAATIVIVKLVSNNSNPESNNSAVTTEKSSDSETSVNIKYDNSNWQKMSCGDTTKTCDPSKNSSCCPKNKN